jgi:hypothetical protein
MFSNLRLSQSANPLSLTDLTSGKSTYYRLLHEVNPLSPTNTRLGKYTCSKLLQYPKL